MSFRRARGVVKDYQNSLFAMVAHGTIQPMSVPDCDFVRAEMLGDSLPKDEAISCVSAYEYKGWVFVRTQDGNNFAWTVGPDTYPFTQEEDDG